MATERIATGNTKFELSLSILETGEKLSGAFTYSTDLFDSSRIERMVGHLRILLEGIVENPEQPVSELRLLTEAERQLMLTQWNQPQRIFSGEGG
jgi:non-ribosomal peptide synthetase component F